MRQLLIFIFKYLSGILFSVDDVLQISLRCLQLVYTRLKICNSSDRTSQTTTWYSQQVLDKVDGGIPLFF
jgi:hypothetical protein